MLALIALATDLPVPGDIRFHPTKPILSLTFEQVSDGQAWSQHLGGQTITYMHSGRRFLDEGQIVWRGWRVQLHASDEVRPDAPLSEDTAARLTALTGTVVA